MFGGSFAPAGWAFCNGQQLPISENETLFQLIGTMYGGDGQETFNLPNLQSRVPMHSGNGVTQAEMAGVETVTLTTQQMTSHNHAFLASGVTGTQITPLQNLGANSVTITPYINTDPDSAFNPQAITPAGGNQPHENLQPYLAISFIISLFGLFPHQN
jgi:microcystin-dependent protein